MLAPYQECALPDANLWIYADTDHSFALGMDGIAMPALEPLVGGPLLTMRIDRLPLVGADRAALGRLCGFGILCSVLCADITIHFVSPPFLEILGYSRGAVLISLRAPARSNVRLTDRSPIGLVR